MKAHKNKKKNSKIIFFHLDVSYWCGEEWVCEDVLNILIHQIAVELDWVFFLPGCRLRGLNFRRGVRFWGHGFQ